MKATCPKVAGDDEIGCCMDVIRFSTLNTAKSWWRHLMLKITVMEDDWSYLSVYSIRILVLLMFSDYCWPMMA